MLHPAAYIEFRKWHRELLGFAPSSIDLAWSWLRQVMGQTPAVAKVKIESLRHPIYLRPWSSDLYVFEQIFMNREYDTPLLKPQTMLDAGANIGLASVYFANRFPDARIVAVEPESKNFEMLRLNTQLYPNIQAVQAAVWSHSGRLALVNSSDKSWAFRFAESTVASASDNELNTCVALDIDELAKRHNDSRSFDLLKIDIEGTEKEVFAAGGQWLEEARCVIVECHDRLVQQCESTVIGAMRSRPFGMRLSGEYLVFERQCDGSVDDGK